MGSDRIRLEGARKKSVWSAGRVCRGRVVLLLADRDGRRTGRWGRSGNSALGQRGGWRRGGKALDEEKAKNAERDGRGQERCGKTHYCAEVFQANSAAGGASGGSMR